jgi:carbamoyltransferase
MISISIRLCRYTISKRSKHKIQIVSAGIIILYTACINSCIMYTLGINAAFHDSAACLVQNGVLIAAAEEERFTHIKHGKRPVPFSAWELPYHAIDYALKTAGIRLADVDHIAYSFDPDINTIEVYPGHNELYRSYIHHAPQQLADGFPHHLQQRLAGACANDFTWHFTDHHLAHAASAFFVSPYTEAAVMTIDGRGENVSTTYYHGVGNELKKIQEVLIPHSLGLLYEAVTSYLGFLHSSDEYKVMALASYGKPVYADVFRKMIQLQGNGLYTIAPYALEERFGPARLRNAPFTEKHFDIAHSLQKVLEETVLELITWLHQVTGSENLCLAGGVALNCVMNTVLRDKGPFKNIWVQPAAGDAGTALGAALLTDIAARKATTRNFQMHHAYWGPAYTNEEVEAFLQWAKLPYRKLNNIAGETAALLADNKVIGWYQGRMEFGPRALGARSILASPLHASMQARLNDIKDREDFRPVAPVVLQEDAGEWFENASYSPFMLFVYNVKPDKADKIPAVRHVDGTARIQTINREQHPCYYALIHEFKKLTGVPVLVNTSFNTRGKPIVCTPRDAVECFFTSPFDALVMNSFLLEKEQRTN